MKKQQGFTLIELLIVVAIIAIIAAIAIPNLLTARMAANETSAIGGVRAIASAQISYMATNSEYCDTLSDLVMEEYLDARFGTSGEVNGYFFGVTPAITKPAAEGGGSTRVFTTTATGFGASPAIVETTGRYCYFIGADMMVRMNTAGVDGGQPCSKFPSNGAVGNPIGGKVGS